jgi:4-hydroxy-tetrahydrodipicolinate reductase
MKIALLGYGKMGKAIEKIAVDRGHQIVLKIGVDNLEDLTKENLEKADVAIEFSTPSTAYDNIQLCFQSGVPVVVGTTGWLEKLQECIEYCQNNKAGLFYASNFSVGVNVFFAINKKLAELMNNYDYSVSMEEIHHTQKLDAPSGTAITLAEGIIEKNSKKSTWVNEPTNNATELEIKSIREADVPGTHSITYSSEIDEIFIQHKAHNRTGFALGAVLAAEYMKDKSGYFGMADLMGLDL